MSENITTGNFPSQVSKISQNTLALLVGQITVQLSGMLLGILIARILGDVGYGQYTLSFAFVGVFSLVFTMGVDYLVVRDIAQSPETSINVVGGAMWLRLIGFPLVLIMTAVTSWILGYQQDQRYLIFIASIALGLSAIADLPRSFFRGIQRMQLDASNRIIEKICTLILAGLCLWFTRRLDLVIIAMGISAFIAMTIGSVIAKHFLGSLHIGNPKEGIKLLKRSAPLATSLALVIIYTNLPTVFLSQIRDIREVGIYSAAYTIVVSLNFIPQALGSALLPVMSILAISEKTRLNRTHNTILSYLTIISLPMTAFIILFGKEMILYIYGSSFVEAVPALMILALSIPFVLWSLYLNNFLIAVGSQHFVLIGSIVFFFATLVFNLYLVPIFGFIGTAISYVIVYGFALATLVYFTSRWVTHKLEQKVIGSVMGTIVMVIVVLAFRTQVIWIRLPLCITAFILGFIATSGMKISEIKSIMRSLFNINVTKNNSL